MNMNTPFTVQEFNEWSEAKEFFDKGLYGTHWVFRGQRKKEWRLESSLDRAAVGASSDKKDIEKFFIFQFRRRAHNYLHASLLPEDDLEWLALMQHHGAPTRLLDFTKSPYIASFFALENATVESVVWAINKKWFADEANFKIADALDHFDFTSLEMSLRNPDTLRKHFRNIFFQLDIPVIYAVEPFRMNERLTVQQGCFLCPGRTTITFEENLMSNDANGVSRNVVKILFDPNIRRDALWDLYLMNINRASLFPGIDGFAQSLKHQMFSPDWDQLCRIAEESFIEDLRLEMRRKYDASQTREGAIVAGNKE